MGRSGQANRDQAAPQRADDPMGHSSELRAFYSLKLADLAEGTADSSIRLYERLVLELEGVRDVEAELDEGDVDDLLLDHNIEMCPSCGWWTKSHELILDEETEEPIGCYDCTDDPDDE